jgi:hypothetical protein
MNGRSAAAASWRCCGSPWRMVSYEYHLPHVLDLVVLAALAERMKTLFGSSKALPERRHGA